MPQQERSHATRRKLLDAAIEVLLDVGYSQLTTSAVAARAGVSRGAQQHHFPVKMTLVVEAIRQLANRHLDDLRRIREKESSDPEKQLEELLNRLFEQFAGPLFKAMLDLWIVSRSSPEIVPELTGIEREISRETRRIESDIVGDNKNADEFFTNYAIALSTARGIAVLGLLGRSRRQINAQWKIAQPDLVANLIAVLRS